MAKKSSAARKLSGSSERSLTDRVQERLAEAGEAIDRTRSKSARGRKTSKLGHTRLGMSTGGPKENADALRETRSLHRVYRELRGTYRKHRRDTGQAALPELREAVHAYKKGPTVAGLVAVAAFLDERGLLEW